MCIGETTKGSLILAQREIERQTEEYLSRGGVIQEMPTGCSAYNVKTKEVSDRGRGSRLVWQDERLQAKSACARDISIKRKAAQKADQAARKRGSE